MSDSNSTEQLHREFQDAVSRTQSELAAFERTMLPLLQRVATALSPRSFRTGDALPNGAIVIHTKEVDGKYIVLANSKKPHADEFVTWGMDARGDTYGGHYHGTNFDAACTDFRTRH